MGNPRYAPKPIVPELPEKSRALLENTWTRKLERQRG